MLPVMVSLMKPNRNSILWRSTEIVLEKHRDLSKGNGNLQEGRTRLQSLGSRDFANLRILSVQRLEPQRTHGPQNTTSWEPKVLVDWFIVSLWGVRPIGMLCSAQQVFHWNFFFFLKKKTETLNYSIYENFINHFRPTHKSREDVIRNARVYHPASWNTMTPHGFLVSSLLSSVFWHIAESICGVPHDSALPQARTRA